MSRLDEVDIAIYDEGTTPTGYWADVLALCRTLAAEVDARDEVITELLEMFGEIICDPSCGITCCGITWTCTRCQAHARACEIAGRTE